MGNFSVNYVLMYLAQQYLTSAMTSIAFSTMLMMNIINTRLFFGHPIAPRTFIGASIGIFGIVALFWDDLSKLDMADGSLLGLALVLTGTLVASLGNMVSVRNSRHDLNIFAVNAWGMTYGCVVLLVFAWLRGAEFTFSMQPSYIASLLYLSVFGTVIAFASYFVLLKNIGPEKASYAIVLFPLVAVTLSSFFEDFVWTTPIILGFVMVLIGNLIVLTPAEKFARITGRTLRSGGIP
jgi:drug/metabolite transporter (DMT)-like permease